MNQGVEVVREKPGRTWAEGVPGRERGGKDAAGVGVGARVDVENADTLAEGFVVDQLRSWRQAFDGAIAGGECGCSDGNDEGRVECLDDRREVVERAIGLVGGAVAVEGGVDRGGGIGGDDYLWPARGTMD